MGNIPLFCWGDDFDPKVDAEGCIIKPPVKIRPKKKPLTFRVNPETFFLLTV